MSLAQAVAVVSLSPEVVGDLLGTHHREVEKACLEIMSAALTDDPRDLALRWRTIEQQLVGHMAAEEHLLMPAFQRAEPQNAHDLRGQHAVLRDHAFEIGVAVQLHAIRCEQLQDFVEELRAHAHREQATLYRWAQDHLDIMTRQKLLAAVR
jgi:hypothetical protein